MGNNDSGTEQEAESSNQGDPEGNDQPPNKKNGMLAYLTDLPMINGHYDDRAPIVSRYRGNK